MFLKIERSNLNLHSKYNEIKTVIVTNCTTDTTNTITTAGTAWSV